MLGSILFIILSPCGRIRIMIQARLGNNIWLPTIHNTLLGIAVEMTTITIKENGSSAGSAVAF